MKALKCDKCEKLYEPWEFPTADPNLLIEITVSQYGTGGQLGRVFRKDYCLDCTRQVLVPLVVK